MSTMYDALKKAEAERKKVVSKESNPETSKTIASEGMSEKVKVIVLLIAVICVFGIAFYRIYSAKMKDQKARDAARNTTDVSVGLSAVKPERAPGTYGLDGVIDAGERSMAIINGKILKPEQSIDHMVLKKISHKEVELLNTKDNTTMVLKLK